MLVPPTEESGNDVEYDERLFAKLEEEERIL
jgi:hypothetical protein